MLYNADRLPAVFVIQYSTVQCKQVACSILLFSTILYNTDRLSAVFYNSVQYCTIQMVATVFYNSVQYCIIQTGKLLYFIIQYNTVQHKQVACCIL